MIKEPFLDIATSPQWIHILVIYHWLFFIAFGSKFIWNVAILIILPIILLLSQQFLGHCFGFLLWLSWGPHTFCFTVTAGNPKVSFTLHFTCIFLLYHRNEEECKDFFGRWFKPCRALGFMALEGSWGGLYLGTKLQLSYMKS